MVKGLLKKAKKFTTSKTGKSLIKVGKTALAGDVYGLEKMALDRAGKAIGKKNLRKGQAFGEDVMGKKNYQATAKGVKRGNRVGANATSAYLAYARGDPVAAAKYGGRTAEAAMGTQALRKIHGAVKDKVGEKNYNTLNNSYKASRHGVTLGYNLAHLSSSASTFDQARNVGNAAKLGMAGYHTAHAATKMAEHLHQVHKGTAANGPKQKTKLIAPPIASQPNAIKGPIGGNSRKPMST